MAGNNYNDPDIIINCINYGNIERAGTKTGAGIIGRNWASNVAIYNCANFGKTLAAIVDQNLSGTCSVANCFNYGECNIFSNTALVYTNCFTLEGKVATVNSNIVTEKTEEYMKSQDFINDLNDYTASNPEGINTADWCKWIINDDNLPILDFNTEWNGTEWVSVTNLY